MSFGSGSNIEVNGGGGSDTLNGGGFDTGATFATDLAATSANTASPVVTSASYTFVAGDVNHYVFVKSGTNSVPCFAKIVSVSAGAATLDAAIGHCVLYNGASATNTAVGIATTASPTSLTWGIDYSRSASARYTFTDLAIDGTTNTKFTSAGNPVGPNFVGNYIVVTSGTGFTTQYIEVLSVSGTTATCDKSLGTLSSTGGHGGLGGALLSPGKAGALLVNGNTCFIVGGNTYNLTSTANVAGGRVNPTANCRYVGYTTSRYPFNLDGTRPVLQSTGSNTYALITVVGSNVSVHNIDFENGNSNTGITGYDSTWNGGQDHVFRCTFKNINVAMKIGGSIATVEYCRIDSCTNASSAFNYGTDRAQVRDCVFVSNAGLSFSATFVDRCIFYGNTWGSGGLIAGTGRGVDGCLFHSNTGNNGVGVNGQTSVTNSAFWNNTGTSSVCVTMPTVGDGTGENTDQIINCAFGSNTGDITTSANFPGYRIVGKLTLTGDPCVNAAGGDFSPNSTAGAGAVLRGAAFPTTLLGSSTTSGLDIGAVQSVAGSGIGPVAGNFHGGFVNG